MAEVYANLVIKGIKKIDQVPERIKEAVLEILNERGWVAPVEEYLVKIIGRTAFWPERFLKPFL